MPNEGPGTRSGGCVAVIGWLDVKPSDWSAVEFELVIDRLEALSVWMVMKPPLTVEGVEVPVIVSIVLSSAPTVSLVLTT